MHARHVRATCAPHARRVCRHAIKLEGARAFLDQSLVASGDVFQMDRGSPNYHLLLDSYQWRLVHDALALGQATRRKVIMPKLWCWVDRYWNNIEGGRFPGVSAKQHPLPFHCPCHRVVRAHSLSSQQPTHCGHPPLQRPHTLARGCLLGPRGAPSPD